MASVSFASVRWTTACLHRWTSTCVHRWTGEQTRSQTDRRKLELSTCIRIAFAVLIIGAIILMVYYTRTSLYTYSVQSSIDSERFLERKERMTRVCSKIENTTSQAVFITGYSPANLSVCIVHKAASTVWLRFLVRLNQTENSTQTVSNAKWEIHHNFVNQIYNLYDEQNASGINRTIKVLTSRNPYTRLWSAYVDKFLFPEFFSSLGREIIENYRPNASEKALSCGHDVTFAEFVRFVIGEGHRIGNYSTHWLPVSDICDPCNYKPDFIVLQETLMHDFKAIMKKLPIIVDDYVSNTTNENTMKDELDHHFKAYFKMSEDSDCVTETDFLQRIWQGLIMNGYIRPTDLPDTTQLIPLKFSKFMDLLSTVRQQHGVDGQLRHDLRHLALVQAYSQIPENDLEALQSLYKLDFEMFGYNPNYMQPNL